jgi:alkylmercury lyase
MTTPTFDQLRAVWTSQAATTRVGETDGRHRTALRLLVEGHPVAATDIATITGEPVAEVDAWLAGMATAGYEFDEHGRLVGAALTLRPTAHRIRVRGNDLYAWCGFDTLFLPILLDEPATVTSTCPATGQPIRLEIAADGAVTRASPATTVVAIVGPEVLATCGQTGPGSAVCDQMPLLATPDAGQEWVRGRRGIAIIDLQDAASLARAYAGISV